MGEFRVNAPHSISFFFNDTATTEIYTLSLHDALPIYEYSKMNQKVEVVRIITDRLKHSAKIQHKEGMISDCEFTSDYFRENAHLFTDADKVYFWDQAVIEQFRKRMYISEIYQLWDWEETEQGVFLILGTKGEYLIDYSIPSLDNIVDNRPIKVKIEGDH